MVGSKQPTTLHCPYTMLSSSDVVDFHFHTKLEDPSIAKKIGLLFASVRPLYGFQGPLHSHGHGSWSVYEAALACADLWKSVRSFGKRTRGI